MLIDVVVVVEVVVEDAGRSFKKLGRSNCGELIDLLNK
jgi:hypothetical protein